MKQFNEIKSKKNEKEERKKLVDENIKRKQDLKEEKSVKKMKKEENDGEIEEIKDESGEELSDIDEYGR